MFSWFMYSIYAFAVNVLYYFLYIFFFIFKNIYSCYQWIAHYSFDTMAGHAHCWIVTHNLDLLENSSIVEGDIKDFFFSDNLSAFCSNSVFSYSSHISYGPFYRPFYNSAYARPDNQLYIYIYMHKCATHSEHCVVFCCVCNTHVFIGFTYVYCLI